MAQPDLMEPMFTEIRMWRVPEADFEVGGRHYGVFAHNWRQESADAWLRLKAERASRIEGMAAPRTTRSVGLLRGGRISQTIQTEPEQTYEVRFNMAGDPDAAPSHKTVSARERGETRGAMPFRGYEQVSPFRSPRTQPASICHSGSLRDCQRRGPLCV